MNDSQTIDETLVSEDGRRDLEVEELRSILELPVVESPDAGRAGVLPTVPAGLSSEFGQLVALPGVNLTPRGGVPVDRLFNGTIGAAFPTVLLSIEVPVNLGLRLERIMFGLDNAVVNALAWSVTVNDVPAHDYTTVPGAWRDLYNLAPLFLYARGPATVRFIQASAAPAGTPFAVRLLGWIFGEHAPIEG